MYWQIAIASLSGKKRFSFASYSRSRTAPIPASSAQVISPGQAWFWSERWQRMERAAQADLDAGRVVEFDTIVEALAALDQIKDSEDAED